MTAKTKRAMTLLSAVGLAGIIVVVAIVGVKKWRHRKERSLSLGAQMAMVNGDYQRAEALFTELLAYRPKNPLVMIGLSETCARLGKFDQAHEWADRAAAAVPSEPKLRIQKASVYRHEASQVLNRLGRAPGLEQFDRVTELCDRATGVLTEIDEAVGASALARQEMGRILTVRADAALHEANGHQEQAEKARADGRSDEVQSQEEKADEWRAKSEAHLDAAIKELGAASKLSPKDMMLAERYAEACFARGRWLKVIVAYRRATTTGKPTTRTVILAARATTALASPDSAADRAQAYQEARVMLTQACKERRFDADLKLELARTELEAGSLEAAEEAIEKATGLQKASSEATLLRARLLLKRDKFREARRLLRTLDADEPNLADAKALLSVAEGRCGAGEKALALLRHAVSLDPDHTEARLRLARDFAGRGFWNAAADLLAVGRRRNPTNLPWVREAATMAVRYGQQDRLDGLIKRAERAAAGRPDVLNELAFLCLKLGRTDWVKRIEAQLLKANPNASITGLGSLAADIAGGKAGEAIKVLAPVGSREGQRPAVYLTLARAYGIEGRLHDAHLQLRKASAAGENDYLTALRVVDLYAELGMLPEARGLSKLLMGQDPEAPATLWQATRLALMGGDLGEAGDLVATLGAVGWQAQVPIERAVVDLLAGRYEQALAECKGQGGPLARLVMSGALSGLGRHDQAAQALEAGIKVDPRHLPLYLRLAEHFVAIGKAEQGLDRLRPLAKIDRANAALAIGRIHLSTRKYDQALDAYQTALAGRKTDKLDKYVEGRLRLAIAACYGKQGKTQDEMAVYQEMQDDEALRWKGFEGAIDLLVRIGRFNQVSALLDKVADSSRIEALSPDQLAQMARGYAQIKQTAKATKIYSRIAKRLPEAMWVWRAMAELYREPDQSDQAVSLIQQALRRWPSYRTWLRELGRVYERVPKLPQAFMVFKTIPPSKDTGSILAERDRALLLSKLGLYEAGRTALEAILLKPRTIDFEVVLELARCLAGQGRIDEALERLSGIPPTSRAYFGARALMVRLEEDRGREEKAIHVLTEAIRKLPRSNELARALFNLRLRHGQVAEARALARRRAADAPEDDLWWALAAGEVGALRSACKKQPGNRGLSLRLAVWLLAGRDWKGVQEVLAWAKPTRPATASAPTTTQAGRQPPPASSSMLALAELAVGKEAAGAARLEALLKRQDLRALWRTVAPIVRLTGGKPARIEQLRQAIAPGAGRLLVDELAKRSKTASGREACRWIAGSLVAQRLALPTLGYHLADAAVQADADSVGAHFVRITALWAMNAARSIKGKKLTDEFLKRFGSSLLGQEVSVRRMLDEGEVDRAVKALKAWDQVGGVPAGLAYEVGVAILAKGDKAEALRWFEQCLERDPDNAMAGSKVASLLVDLRGDDMASKKRALKLAQQSLRRRGGHVSAAETTGWVLVKCGRLKAGIEMLQRVIIPLADDVLAHYHLAVAYQSVRAVEMAEMHFEHVAKSSKNKALADEARKALERLRRPRRPTTTTTTATTRAKAA